MQHSNASSEGQPPVGSAKKNWIQASVLAPVSIVLFYIAFSLPPWDMESIGQDIAVLVLVVTMLLGWIGFGGLLALAGKSNLDQGLWLLSKLAWTASLAGVWLGGFLVLAFWIFDVNSELNVFLFLAFLLWGICFSVATLTAYWVRWVGIPIWVGVLGGGVAGPTFLGVGFLVANAIYGESILQIDSMMLL